MNAKPNDIIDISAITSIYRPGPLSANVDKLYVEAKNNPSKINYVNDIAKTVTEETAGFLIFQEQIALLAHKLGKGVTLEEGNKLRKLLTKKGTGKGAKEKKISNKDLLKAVLISQSIDKPQNHSGEILSILVAMVSINLTLLLIAFFLISVRGF